MAPGVEIGPRIPRPVPDSDVVSIEVVIDVDAEGKNVDETRWRPDFLDKKAKASVGQRNRAFLLDWLVLTKCLTVQILRFSRRSPS